MALWATVARETFKAQNEDRLAIIWDMQNDAFVTTGTCTAMCHAAESRMYTAAGTVDTWHWKASRTGGIGFTDDKWWDDGAGGTASGRHSDAGASVFSDNADNGGTPSFMSAAGPGTSAKFLFAAPAAPGFERSVAFDDTPGLVPTDNTLKSAKLKLDLSQASNDGLSIKGSFDKNDPPESMDGLAGTLEIGSYSRAFQLKANGKSEKDANIKVKITAKKGKWNASVKKVDLQAGLGVSGDGGGIPREFDWTLSLANGWTITGTVGMTGKVNADYGPKAGGKRKFKYKQRRR